MMSIRQFIFWVLIIFLIGIFETQIDAFICNHFVNLAFNSLLVKASCLILAGYFTIEIVRNIKVFNKSIFINCIGVLFIYLLYRCNFIEHSSWKFVNFFGKIKYVDIIVIPLFACIVKCIERNIHSIYIKSKIKENLDYEDNSPIRSKNLDKYNYAKDAENLLEIIVNNRNGASKEAVIIGLQGKWGQGKTSYLNLMKECALLRNDVILLRINVWQCQNYHDLVKCLFKTIGDGINDISIKNTTNDYAKFIIDSNISYLSKIFYFFKREKNYEELFQRISNQIRELGKTVIIQVDDLDRLTSEEVLYTLKLIRNVANFNNIFFIVAYDGEYIKERLKLVNVDSSYLEKVFNVVYPLPVIEKDNQTNLIKNILINSLYIDINVEQVINQFMTVIDNDITLRNAKRLSHSIQYSLSDLKDDKGNIKVDMLDYILVSYLQMINIRAYDFLANFNYDDFQLLYSDKCIKCDPYRYYLNLDKDPYDFRNKDLLNEEEYKEERLKKDVGDDNLDLIYSIFRELFNDNRLGAFRICNANSYNLYFNRTFNEFMIEKGKFKTSFENSMDEFKKDLRRWNENKSFDQIILMDLIDDFSCETKEEWEKFFDALLEITPESYSSFLLSRLDISTIKLIPSPGFNILNTHNNVDYNKREEFLKAIDNFFYNRDILENDTIDRLVRKLTLILKNRNYYMLNKRSYREVFDLYWNLYLDKDGGSYDIFDEDFWMLVYLEEPLDKIVMRDILRKHIESNINDFIRNYSIRYISGNIYFNSIFCPCDVINNNIYCSKNKWIDKFKDFLDNIENKSPELLKYIEELDRWSTGISRT